MIKQSKFDDRLIHAHTTQLLIKCLVATLFLRETCEQLVFLVVYYYILCKSQECPFRAKRSV